MPWVRWVIEKGIVVSHSGFRELQGDQRITSPKHPILLQPIQYLIGLEQSQVQVSDIEVTHWLEFHVHHLCLTHLHIQCNLPCLHPNVKPSLTLEPHHIDTLSRFIPRRKRTFI